MSDATSAPADRQVDPDAPGLGPTAAGPTTPSVRTALRRARGPLAAAGVLLLIAVAAAVGADPGAGLLDTRSTSAQGSRALAEVLRDQGTPVTQVRNLAEAAATNEGTLLVAGPDLLPPDAVDRLAASGATTVVLVAATRPEVVQAFVPTVEVGRSTGTGVREPACALPAAALAGPADVGGTTYTADAGADGTSGPDGGVRAVGCYPVGGTPSLLVVDGPTRDVVLLGTSTPLQNDELPGEGNAALALNLTGSDGPLTWYLPSLEDLYGSAATAPKSWFDLVPRAVVWSLGWLALVVVLLALWRARRLGPVVPEALPVVVRAAETVEGRARLYRRSRDRGRAAALLRSATRDRLVPIVGLPVDAGPDAVIDAVSRRSGRDPVEVAALLYGAPPREDARLVRLADDLDRLDREVREP